MTSDRPSRFWQKLSAQHEGELELYGVENFKQHQALRYFTWQWHWSRLWKSEQMRFLLTHTSPSSWLACASTPMDLQADAWRDCQWTRQDRWLYTFATRLLWSYARKQDTTGALELEEPTLGNPFPVYWDGRLISQDLANGALEAAAMASALGGRRPTSILEVGAGYGRTGYVLLNQFPEARYTIVDIEPAINISREYLTTLFPGRDIRFLSPDQVDEIADASVDLGLSISSLQEMTPAHVDSYLSLFDRVAADGVVYLKQWSTWYNPDDGVTLAFDDYPLPRRWQRLLKRRAQVQTRFTEAAWEIGSGAR